MAQRVDVARSGIARRSWDRFWNRPLDGPGFVGLSCAFLAVAAGLLWVSWVGARGLNAEWNPTVGRFTAQQCKTVDVFQGSVYTCRGTFVSLDGTYVDQNAKAEDLSVHPGGSQQVRRTDSHSYEGLTNANILYTVLFGGVGFITGVFVTVSAQGLWGLRRAEDRKKYRAENRKRFVTDLVVASVFFLGGVTAAVYLGHAWIIGYAQ
jgi:hypothetical protein